MSKKSFNFSILYPISSRIFNFMSNRSLIYSTFFKKKNHGPTKNIKFNLITNRLVNFKRFEYVRNLSDTRLKSQGPNKHKTRKFKK